MLEALIESGALDALGDLARLTLCGATFVLFGDYGGQFDSARGGRGSVGSARLQNSQLLRDMAANLQVHLATYKRGHDEAFHDFYHGLADSNETIKEMAAKAQRVLAPVGRTSLAGTPENVSGH